MFCHVSSWLQGACRLNFHLQTATYILCTTFRQIDFWCWFSKIITLLKSHSLILLSDLPSKSFQGRCFQYFHVYMPFSTIRETAQSPSYCVIKFHTHRKYTVSFMLVSSYKILSTLTLVFLLQSFIQSEWVHGHVFITVWWPISISFQWYFLVNVFYYSILFHLF